MRKIVINMHRTLMANAKNAKILSNAYSSIAEQKYKVCQIIVCSVLEDKEVIYFNASGESKMLKFDSIKCNKISGDYPAPPGIEPIPITAGG